MINAIATRFALGCVFSASLGACSTLQNTPVQDYVWDISRYCNVAGVTMTHVDPDGRYRAQGVNVTSFDAFTSCMAEQQRLHPYQEWLNANKRDAAAGSSGAKPK